MWESLGVNNTKLNQFEMVNKYDFNYQFAETVGGLSGLAFLLFFSVISQISKRLLFKFICDSVAEGRSTIFLYFCAYLHSVKAYFHISCGMPGQLKRSPRGCLVVEKVTNHHSMSLPLVLAAKQHT